MLMLKSLLQIVLMDQALHCEARCVHINLHSSFTVHFICIHQARCISPSD